MDAHRTRPGQVAVVGGSGFVGTAAVEALRADGWIVTSVEAPRLHVEFGTDPATAADAWRSSSTVDASRLAEALGGHDVVVNAAGLATPTAGRSGDLWGANAVLPLVLAHIAAEAHVTRFVHVSSAAVQGSQAMLDDAPAFGGHSPYAESKAAGEQAVLQSYGPGSDSPLDAVVYRPTSVLGPGRGVAIRLAQVLQSKWLMVPAGDAPLPVALVERVGAAVSFLSSAEALPDSRIVVHPSEGMTVRSLAASFGRDEPIRTMPTAISKPARWLIGALARRGPVAGQARRVELLWEGQTQSSAMPALGFDPAAASTATYEALGTLLLDDQGKAS